MSLDKIKKLRERTGAGFVAVKSALDMAGGDEEKAVDILRKKGQERATKKTGRSTEEGIVASYIHSNGRVGAIVKILCETDFVARTDEFKTLAQDIAMHITAMNPEYIRPEDVSEEEVAREKEIWTEQLKNEGKQENLIPNILVGKEKKFRSEAALLTQNFVKNQDLTVDDLIKEKIGKIGENIKIGEFKRVEL